MSEFIYSKICLLKDLNNFSVYFGELSEKTTSLPNKS